MHTFASYGNIIHRKIVFVDFPNNYLHQIDYVRTIFSFVVYTSLAAYPEASLYFPFVGREQRIEII